MPDVHSDQIVAVRPGPCGDLIDELLMVSQRNTFENPFPMPVKERGIAVSQAVKNNVPMSREPIRAGKTVCAWGNQFRESPDAPSGK